MNSHWRWWDGIQAIFLNLFYFNWVLIYKINLILFEYQASNSNVEWTLGFTSLSWFIQFHYCPALHFTLLKGFSYVLLLSFCCQADWIWGIFYYACQKVFLIGNFFWVTAKLLKWRVFGRNQPGLTITYLFVFSIKNAKYYTWNDEFSNLF